MKAHLGSFWSSWKTNWNINNNDDVRSPESTFPHIYTHKYIPQFIYVNCFHQGDRCPQTSEIQTVTCWEQTVIPDWKTIELSRSPGPAAGVRGACRGWRQVDAALVPQMLWYFPSFVPETFKGQLPYLAKRQHLLSHFINISVLLNDGCIA